MDIYKWWISLNDFWKKSITVHLELNKINITYSQILESTTAICNEPVEDIYQNITKREFKMPSIIDFEKALGLNFFYVRDTNCDITDINPLTILNQLEIVDFSFNKVNSLNPIINCTNLKILNFECNEIITLEPIKSLTNLLEINCGRNKITDLSPLKNMNRLTSLKTDQNPLKSLTGIQNLLRLQYFDCSDDQGGCICRLELRDLNYLTKLKSLKRLKLDSPSIWNEISDADMRGQDIGNKMKLMFPDCEITY